MRYKLIHMILGIRMSDIGIWNFSVLYILSQANLFQAIMLANSVALTEANCPFDFHKALSFQHAFVIK